MSVVAGYQPKIKVFDFLTKTTSKSYEPCHEKLSSEVLTRYESNRLATDIS